MAEAHANRGRKEEDNDDDDNSNEAPPVKKPKTNSDSLTQQQQQQQDGETTATTLVCSVCHGRKDIATTFSVSQLKKKNGQAKCRDCVSTSLNPEGPAKGRCCVCHQVKDWIEFKKRERRATQPTCLQCRQDRHYIVCSVCGVQKMRCHFTQKQRNHKKTVAPICNDCKHEQATRLNQLPRKCCKCGNYKPRDCFSSFEWKDVPSWNATEQGLAEMKQQCLDCLPLQTNISA